MVLGGYGVVFGAMVCCVELDLSFLRRAVASNFGFLHSPSLRFLFYLLMGMVSWSFGTVLGTVASATLGTLALVNTYVLCRYPGYARALREIADDEERRMRKEGRRQAWKHGAGLASLPWWEV